MKKNFHTIDNVYFQVGILLLFAIVLRIVLFFQFPLFLTGDSWGYLEAATGIFRHWNFQAVSEQAVLLPGYPVFLAIIYPLTKMDSAYIVLSQKSLGMASVLLGIFIGYRLDSRLIANGLGIFLGANPVFLLFEHTAMAETLAIFLFMAFSAVVLIWLQGNCNWRVGLMLGGLFAASVLTRVNLLPFFTVLAIGSIGQYVKQNWRAYRNWRLQMPVIFMILAAAVPMFLWLKVNYETYGNISLTNFNNRNMLFYKSLHDPLDMSLPLMAEITNSFPGEETRMGWGWLYQMKQTYPTLDAEGIARQLLLEQILASPAQHGKQVMRSLWGFGGFYQTVNNELASVLFWFSHPVATPSQLHVSVNKRIPNPRAPDFVYDSVGSGSIVTRIWAWFGVFYLTKIRPIVFVLYFIVMIFWGVFFIRHRRDLFPIFPNLHYLILLNIGMLLTILSHAVMLADNDRYATPFDWFYALVILAFVIDGRFPPCYTSLN